SYDSEYANAVSTLQGSGSNVIGSIATNYSSNGNISNLLQQVSNYNSWYGVNGIFYDEMSTSNSNVSFYQDLYDKTKIVLEKNV
uniref:spherulation-specific family 4 protein n=1 Tax=Streptococcus mitis TaxID=28037 RepID=UPI0021B6C64E